MANSLSPAERAQLQTFCEWLAALGNPFEAARRAGLAEESALRMLHAPTCTRILRRMTAQPSADRASVLAGLSRLAFGAANDAARLVFAQEPPTDSMIAALDLFQVSEMKRDKAGGVEIRLFDRQKALERLLEITAENDAKVQAQALLAALGGGDDA